ncbi:MAG TPA: AbrB/MazE/SpoVT family DNA-binding domain-containing protein [Nanoarchaeota archaeon]|nr:AbrB/MazE/SpoVT family DNA-binding domain-containing protein [Nanoarchaeota archaeon]
MKLQKQLSRKYEGKDYAKYVIVIKPTYIEQLGWKKSDELKVEVKDNKLVIEKD